MLYHVFKLKKSQRPVLKEIAGRLFIYLLLCVFVLRAGYSRLAPSSSASETAAAGETSFAAAAGVTSGSRRGGQVATTSPESLFHVGDVYLVDSLIPGHNSASQIVDRDISYQCMYLPSPCITRREYHIHLGQGVEVVARLVVLIGERRYLGWSLKMTRNEGGKPAGL
jgi:hypothetical protein